MAKGLGFMEAARIQSEINRLFDNLLEVGDASTDGSTWIPNADIVETDEILVVLVELPGVAPEGVRLTIDSGNVILEGEKPAPKGPPGSRFQMAERQFGKFRRVVSLGVPVNTRLANANLADGLLTIEFPRVPNRRGEVVEIEVTGE